MNGVETLIQNEIDRLTKVQAEEQLRFEITKSYRSLQIGRLEWMLGEVKEILKEEE